MKRANGQVTPAVAPNSRCEGIAAARAALHERVVENVQCDAKSPLTGRSRLHLLILSIA